VSRYRRRQRGFYNLEQYPAVPFSQLLFHDGTTRVPGLNPVSTPPNDYLISGSGQTLNWFSRLRGMTSAAFLDVEAVYWTGDVTPNNVGVWVDGVYHSTLVYTTLGVKQIKRINLPNDGQFHLVEIEEQAAITNVIGNVAWQPPVSPTKRVILIGDSVTAGFNASVRSKGWSDTVRHALPAGYGCTIIGYPGMTMYGMSFGNYPPAHIASLCNGATTNIVVVSLMINDWSIGVTLANFDTAISTWITAMKAAKPGVKILLNTAPQSPNAGGGAGTLAQYRAVLAALVGVGVTYLDNGTLFPGVSPWGTYIAGDGVHLLDPGMALMASAVTAKILTL
jgi:lysophospholipase L1-like esterase